MYDQPSRRTYPATRSVRARRGHDRDAGRTQKRTAEKEKDELTKRCTLEKEEKCTSKRQNATNHQHVQQRQRNRHGGTGRPQVRTPCTKIDRSDI